LLTWCEESYKILNQNKEVDRLSVGVAGFMVIGVWFVIKWRGGLQLFADKNRGRRNNEGEGEGDCSLDYKFNITDRFTNRYH